MILQNRNHTDCFSIRRKSSETFHNLVQEMKKWPEELQVLDDEDEVFLPSGKFTFKFRATLTSAQRKILRKFLFDLKNDEEFLFFHKELEREFIAKLFQSRTREQRISTNSNGETL